MYEVVGQCWCRVPLRQWGQVKSVFLIRCAFVKTQNLSLNKLHGYTVSLSIRPSHILLSCGIPAEVAANALRLSVGRYTSKADVDTVVEDLRNTVQLLEEMD